MAPAAPAGKGWKSMRNGALLQCAEAITLGMPLEVWKTHMGRFRHLSTFDSLTTIYKQNGLGGFWKGTTPKMIECASKGAVFLYTKELIVEGCASAGVGKVTAGFAAGAGAGVCQVVVMGPCTFLVTAAVTGGGQTSISSTISQTLRDKGLLGFYPGGLAIAFRQATNWASRQGLTDVVRSRMRTAIHSDPNAKLTSSQDALCGCLGGILSAWNHPFEVARIEMQARAIAGQESLSMMGVFREVIEQYGVRGLFQGILPRMGLSMWQTLFMVSGATYIKERLG